MNRCQHAGRGALLVTAISIPIALAACAAPGSGPGSAASPRVPDRPVNEADARFMSGMIPHHAQAVLFAGWAESHGASPAIQRLCERIIVAQQDEIALMQSWLADRGLPVPAADATHMVHVENGVEHRVLMPGMLNAEQLTELDRARGEEFDRLFLINMILHHEGAIAMVDELFTSYGAAQDEIVFRFASDVYADQTTEIDFMEKMLAAMQERS